MSESKGDAASPSQVVLYPIAESSRAAYCYRGRPELVAGEKGSDFTAMGRARELDRLEGFVSLSGEEIKRSPEYTEASLLKRDYETGLYLHHNRPGYWVDELVAK